METSSANALAAKQDQAAARRRRLLGAQLARSAARRCRTLARARPSPRPGVATSAAIRAVPRTLMPGGGPAGGIPPGGRLTDDPSTRQGRACARLSVITQVGLASTSPEHLLAHFSGKKGAAGSFDSTSAITVNRRATVEISRRFQRAASRPRRSTPQRIETSSQNTRRGTPRRGPAVTPLRRASRPRRPGRRADPGWQAS